MYCKNCGEMLNDQQAVCLKCGVPVGKGKGFCQVCGNPVAEEAVICVNCGAPIQNEEKKVSNVDTTGISKRSLVTAIILSIVTCGIYDIYWYIVLTNEMNKASGRTTDLSGGMSYLLSLVTCGIYSFFWAYKMGEKRDIVANEKGSSAVLYLILSLFGFGFLVYCFAQDALNKAIDKNN